MSTSSPAAIRADLIDRLGFLLPQLMRKIHYADYVSLESIHSRLSRHPNDSGYMRCYLAPYTGNLPDIIRTDELYQTNPESKTLIESALTVLEEIVRAR